MTVPDRPTSAQLERAIAELESSLEPLFAAGRYRDFFARAHAVRAMFKTARLPQETRTRLWDRLNRCTEAAKEWQEREFATRNKANLDRWTEQVAVAEWYAAALAEEIAGLAARKGPPAEQELWRRRIVEKEARLIDVRSNVAALRRKIADVSRRGEQ